MWSLSGVCFLAPSTCESERRISWEGGISLRSGHLSFGRESLLLLNSGRRKGGGEGATPPNSYT